MNLWIRSQDRTILRKVNTIGIVEGIDFWSIDENLTVSFGQYKTKERAIEVLDEIQNILKPKYILDSSSIRPGDSWVENGVILQKYNANARIEELSTFVYEMPVEWGD